METDDRKRRCRRHREHGHAADENHPGQALRARHALNSQHGGNEATGQMMRDREDRGKRPIRRIRLAVDSDLAEEHRLRADDLAIDDDGFADFRGLRHGQIAGVDQMLGLEVDLEFIGSPERIPRRGQCVEGLEEKEEKKGYPGSRGSKGSRWRQRHRSAVPVLRLSADTRPAMNTTLRTRCYRSRTIPMEPWNVGTDGTVERLSSIQL